ncbi:hypothetical protein GBAR_LOCUS18545 [Geodia barretti]|uniref:Uncharacterized protein n=1 Tax=Geodia barretti TaxID=519541 RepID=A0AA35WU46_GEOBA|nr:hypothetical protein GBAR_LOCUS18545 [Geodia barretti]
MEEGERANPRKRALSKNLSQMKFMKRHTLGNAEEEVDSVGGVLTEKWVVPDAPPSAKCSTIRKRIDSFVECEELDTFGRYSYNGCNKEIERLARSRLTAGSPSVVEPEEDADVTAEEVVQRHEVMGLKRGERKRRREKHFEKILDKKWS